MALKSLFIICLQVCLFQTALTQFTGFGPYGIGSGPQTGAPCGIGSLGSLIGPNPGLAQSSLGVAGPLGIPGNIGPAGPAYGATGSGAVAVAGELPVAGSTLVTGQVPVVGGVQFSGTVPAAGTITVTGSCCCGAPNGY